jgi:hypothetical protein
MEPSEIEARLDLEFDCRQKLGVYSERCLADPLGRKAGELTYVPDRLIRL